VKLLIMQFSPRERDGRERNIERAEKIVRVKEKMVKTIGN
jgi:hypothetical protein